MHMISKSLVAKKKGEVRGTKGMYYGQGDGATCLPIAGVVVLDARQGGWDQHMTYPYGGMGNNMWGAHMIDGAK